MKSMSMTRSLRSLMRAHSPRAASGACMRRFVSNAATSPLNVLLLSGLIKLGLPGLWAAYALECLLAVAIFFALEFYFAARLRFAVSGPMSRRSLCSPIRCLSRPRASKPISSSPCCLAAASPIFWNAICCLALRRGFLVLARPDGALLLVPLFALMAVRNGADAIRSRSCIGFATCRRRLGRFLLALSRLGNSRHLFHQA